MAELRNFFHTIKADHLKRFILWSVGTAARPSSIFELHSDQIDIERRLVILNPQGRQQTKKHRPTVKLPRQLIMLAQDGFQIEFRGKPIASIKKAWRNHRTEFGFDKAVNPYSLRHTMARHLRASGVPAWEVAAQMGHKKREMSVTEIYAPFDPSYLSQSVAAIEEFLEELLKPITEQELDSLPVHCQQKNGESDKSLKILERAMRFELTTPTWARLCSTPELRPHPWVQGETP